MLLPYILQSVRIIISALRLHPSMQLRGQTARIQTAHKHKQTVIVVVLVQHARRLNEEAAFV